jgi:hypothetical protein
MRRTIGGCAAAVAALLLAACEPEGGMGFVEIKILPGYSVPQLAIEAELIDLKSDTTVLQRKVGSARLQADRNGQLITFCEFQVLKNRITSVSISSTGRDLRCRVKD